MSYRSLKEQVWTTAISRNVGSYEVASFISVLQIRSMLVIYTTSFEDREKWMECRRHERDT
jgi:hypothetical protein